MLRNVWPILLVGLIGLVASDAFALDEEERRLLQEIVKATQQEYDANEQLFLNGKLYFRDLSDAARRLGEAKLKLASTPQEKLQAWEDIVKMAAKGEELALNKNGTISTAEVSRARAQHLEAQLGLYRAKKALKAAR